MASSIAALFFAVCVIIVTAGVVWFHIVRPIFESYGIIRVPESVNRSQIVMSPAQPQTKPDDQTDGPDRRASATLSAHDRLWSDFQLDRTRARLITVMIDSQIPVADIRRLLTGDNTVISAEVAEARKRLGLTPPEEYRTPIAGRPTGAEFQQDPDLAYQPPPR